MDYFDLHCDTLTACFEREGRLDVQPGHVDLARGSRFDRWAQVFAVFVPDTMSSGEAGVFCRRVLSFARDQQRRFSDCLTFVETGTQLREAWSTGRCAGLLAIENGAALDETLDTLEEYAALGVKIITITWNGSNALGHGCLSGCVEGLTPFGKAAVQRMEACGILPDVSHLNERGFWDVAALTEGPFLATHSVSAAVHPHPRNLTDEQFREIVRRGGLVGVNFCREHLGEQTFDCLERHIDHFLSLGGEDVLAIGADFDGTDLREDWKGIEILPQLREALSRKNYDESCLNKLFFSNCTDFFTTALTNSIEV